MKFRYRNEDEMKDSDVEWIGKIPNQWDVIKGKYLFESNKVKNSGEFQNILSLTLNGVIDRNKENFEGLQPESFDGYQEFYKDNLVFKLIDLENIKTSRVGYVHKFGLMSPAYIRLEKKKNISVKYYYYNYYNYYNQNIYNFLGSVGVRSALNSTDLLDLDIINNSFEEQEKIARFLDEKTAEFDSIISKKEALIEKLEEAKKSLISEVVTGKVKVVKTSDRYELVERKKEEMKDSGVEWLGYIPREWNIKKIKYVSSLKSGESITSDNIRDDAKYPVYGGNGLRGYTDRFTHKGKYILIGRQGALCGNINYTNDEFWASEHAIVVNPLLKVDTLWLGELLRSMNLNQYSISAAQPGLAVGMIENLSIPFIEYNKQLVISDFINKKILEIKTTVEKTKQQIEKLKEAKQSLISEAVTGKIEILE
ncbi:MAG: restriction endonuclease subunit S [Clostridium perfringens]